MKVTLSRRELSDLLTFLPPALAERAEKVLNRPKVVFSDTRRDTGEAVEVVVEVGE